MPQAHSLICSIGDFKQDAFIMWEPEDVSTTIGIHNYNDGSSYPDPRFNFGLGPRHGDDCDWLQPHMVSAIGQARYRRLRILPYEGL